ncbi:YihY/virulence factor BrkB family protein [Carnobacterium gallinarum]|uniref:YihY/virulence factor BrkB family protein n=1 Tax=Carnobacterium gallinarum TaxID=2749 RepID=UPI000556F5E6|nr:YihY/virulence factor BrkB family protein [Carnobacterium gallinarum]
MLELSEKEQRKAKLTKVLKITEENWTKANISSQAAQLAYYVLLSLFPVLLVAGNLIPFLPINVNQIYPYLESSVPADIYKLLTPILDSILHSSSGTAISFGVITAIWSSSSGFNALQQVLNVVYGANMRKNFIIARIFSFFIALVMIAVLGAVILVFVFGEQVMQFLQEKLNFSMTLLPEFTSIKWIGTIVVLLVVFIMLYWLVPNVKWGFKYTLPGAIFATVGWLVSSQAFSLYVRFQGGKSIGTGTLSIFIVLMLWLYLIATILLLGGFLNVLVYHYRKEIKAPKEMVGLPKKGNRQRRNLRRNLRQNL